jgi:hypothetical protein
VVWQQEQPEFSLWRIPAEGGKARKIGLDMNISSLSLHPDGRHIAFSTLTLAPAEVWVMENFLPEKVVSGK